MPATTLPIAARQYLVFCGDGNDHNIVGAFDSHEEAAAFAAGWHGSDGRHYWAIPSHVARLEGLV